MAYPGWLRDIFVLMTATYQSLWANQFVDEITTEAIKRVWWMQLKEFKPNEIREAIFAAGTKYKYPPKPAELIEIIKNVRDRQKDKDYFKMMDEKRLLPKPTIKSLSKESLLMKIKMWESLGRMDKVKAIEDEIAGLDMQKE